MIESYTTGIDFLSDSRIRAASSSANGASTQRLTGHREEARLREVSREFEALFIKQMLDTMRKTIQKSDLNDGGFAEEIYEDMLYDQYAQTMAKTKSFGIAKMLYNQLSAYI